MAPLTQTSPRAGLSIDPRSPRTVRPDGQNVTKTSVSVTPSARNTQVGFSTSTKPSVTDLPPRTTQIVRVSSTQGSTQRLSSVRNTNITSSSTQTPVVIGLSTTESSTPAKQESTTASSTTTLKTTVNGGRSPGGIHTSFSAVLPPVTQGQFGTTPAGSEETNTTAIIAGVLVPLILIGVGAFIFYIWYRRKYPVRMVLGRDFNRFSNPAYSKRASTFTLVREDAEKEWERIDTLSRKNLNLSMVNEDEPDGIFNTAFELENEETHGEVTIEKRAEISIEKNGTDTEKAHTNEEMPSNISITRERPKTKKAILVKTDTMEDLENGFELVTESDLEKRTESDISSGNESTGTHTISLSFSETFDDRHKDDQISITDKEHDKNGDYINTHNLDENKLNNKEAEISLADSHDTVKVNENDENDKEIKSEKPERKETNVAETTETEIQNTERDMENDNISSQTVSYEMLSRENDNVPFEESVKDTKIERDTDENINDYQSEECLDVVTNGTNALSIIAEQTGSNEKEENISNQDNSLEILSDSNNVLMESPGSIQNTNENVVHNNISLLEKEKTEILEKEEDKYTEDEKGGSECSLNGTELDQVSTDEGNFSQDEAPGKKPYLNISNENIVLETVPPTPTKFVQESFILETEATLPVYLDNIHASPVRGRRAFTLNDIVPDPILGNGGNSKGFSLPKRMDEISKSSPVLSEIQPIEIQDFEKKHFNFVPLKGDTETTKILSEDNLDQSSSIKEDVDILKDKIEDKEKTSDATTNKQDIYTFESSVQNGFDLAGSLPKSTELENENIKMLESGKKDFSKLDQDKPRDPSDQIVSADFSETRNDPFNFFSVDNSQDHLLNETENESFTTSFKKTEKVHAASDDIFLANTKSEENMEIGSSSRNKEIRQKEVASGAILNDSTLFNVLPQSSAPTASFIEGFNENSTKSSHRKKVLPQKFDFNNASVSDNSDSVKSESSDESENEDIENSEKKSKDHAMSFDIHVLESELFGQEKPKTDSRQDELSNIIQKENPASEDVFSLTESNDSATAQSLDLLSTENSQAQSKIDHNGENIPGLLEFSLNSDENNKTNTVLSLSSENTNKLDLMSEISKQTLSNNTSLGSSALTDGTDLGILNEGDNSEC